ncbi:deoxyribodipyrimidine photo-lyase [Tichowtungia aerotolerans]|uniref:Deoxyribodipyrimidine photo-lyase n=1 Tax=Tichowtungia aerotolerans TaxID=2697043 RepID=A0A6P1MB90_9BACT|nr:deoxyribodipyrimidine photo-lyase [Tichowtungia aerotolerans]QHI68826.1 deoxyribodipyrimidine photolyase [Tichowtungia aerotolerans]
MIHPARIHKLNDKPVRQSGGFVLYWMQQSQRAEWNHALEYAIERANQWTLPVAVVFGLMDDYPEANERHYAFMLQGLEEVFQTLEKRGIGAFIGRGHPADVAIEAGKEAALIVCDMGYLRHQAEWRARVADESDCEVVEVESDVVVPVETASDKPEYMARTLRPKIHRNLNEFLQPLASNCVAAREWFQGLEKLSRQVPTIGNLKLDRSVGAVKSFKGGTAEAKRRLKQFIKNSLAVYSDHSNQPQTDDVSMMSPYLHFGQISPLTIALEVLKSDAAKEAQDAFIEQLIVRRELAMNFVWFTPDYDQFSCLPNWAKQTLKNHAKDEREYLYTREQFEQSQTHDPYWNAAMTEMRVTGFMHNYMRMYWGKKVLEWSPSPEEAFETLLAINNKYFIDGRDPNSYAGVAWVFGKHDTAWAARPVFGKTRYMNAAGLKRKCDINAYVEKVERL